MRKRISWLTGIIMAAGMILMSFPVDAVADTEEWFIEENEIAEEAVIVEEADIIEETGSVDKAESIGEDEKDVDGVTPDGTSLTAAYYVTGDASPVDQNASAGYVPVTGSQNGDRELYSAFYNDMIYERQGGRWYWGHEAIMYNASSQNVYGDPGHTVLATAPESLGDQDMVFELNYMPVELSENYRHNLYLSGSGLDPDWRRLPGVELWAWEYEQYTAPDGSVRYRRVKTKQLQSSEYEVDHDEDAYYTNWFMAMETEPFNLGSDPAIYGNIQFTEPAFGTKGTLYFDKATLPGAVKLNGSWMKNSSDPVAIVAMIYDATKGTYAPVDELARGDHDIWENDRYFSMCTILSDITSDKYNYSRNYYNDDPYTSTAMGTFSPVAYNYHKNDETNLLTLYSGGLYAGFASGFARGSTDSYRDRTGSDLKLDTWEIPARWTDELTGKTYNVRIDNTPILDTGVYRGYLFPCMAETLIIDAGVIMPEDCSYFLLNSANETRVNLLKNFKIKGNPGSFGSNIKNLSHFFKKSYSLTENYYDSIDVRAFDTSNVEDMSYMFEDVILTGSSTSVNVNVSNFNTGKVKSFKGMFKGYHVTDGGTVRHYYTKVNTSGFNTSNAETMAFMFCDMHLTENTGCGTLDLSNFRFTDKLTDMQGMFAGNISYETPGLVKIIFPAEMDTSNVRDMSYLFCADDSLREIVNFTALDTGNVVDISGMFGKYIYDRLFGSMSNQKNLPETYWGSMDTGSWVYDRLKGVGAPNLYRQDATTGFFGPALETLDLTNFDTRNVKYAYGAFCWMPNLKEIKWGSNTTFEKVTDANYMFILPALKELDLTGRKFTSLKYAFRMIMIDSAESLILGNDSLDLSSIAVDEGFTVSAPRVKTVDLRKVAFGDNAKAFSKYSLYDEYYQTKYVPEGFVAATEMYFPSMPAFETAADLPVAFTDETGTKYTSLQGGNTGELHMTADDISDAPAVETIEVRPVIDIGSNSGGWMMNNGEKEQLMAMVTPARADNAVTWSSSDPSIATVDEDGLVTAIGGKSGGTEVVITATSVSDSSKKGSYTLTVYLAMLNGGEEPTPGPGPDPTLPGSVTLVKGQKMNIKPYFVSAGFGFGKKSKFSLPKGTKCASITKAGVLTGKAAGSAEVLLDGKPTGMTVVIETPVMGIKTKYLTYIGQTFDGASNISGLSGVSIDSWTSSNPKVATVDPLSGLVTAVGKGKTTISAVFNNVGVKGSAGVKFTVRVKIPGLSKKTATVKTGATLKLKAKNIVKGTAITWTSSDPDTASVDPGTGLVKGLKVGEADIYTMIDGQKYSCHVTVPAPAAKKPSLTFKKAKGSASIALKNTKLKPSAFTWVSDNPAVAEVGETTGKITVRGLGTAVITGTYNGMTVTVNVKVGK